MKSTLKCLECSLHGFLKLLDEFKIKEREQHTMMRNYLQYLSEMDFNVTPPEITRQTQKFLKEHLHTNDPYEKQKKMHNRLMLDKYDIFYKEIIKTADPVKSAIILSIAGNVIDLSPHHNFSMEKIIKNALQTKLKIDDSNALIRELKQGKSLLYLADNAGEIVLDKLSIRILLENNIITKEQITVVVRGYPVINDATMIDAKEIGLTDLVHVTDNGDNASGTILKTTSAEFKKLFKKSELIISKGQGNYETLNHLQNKNIYFLFIAKCLPIASQLNVGLGDFICKKCKNL